MKSSRDSPLSLSLSLSAANGTCARGTPRLPLFAAVAARARERARNARRQAQARGSRATRRLRYVRTPHWKTARQPRACTGTAHAFEARSSQSARSWVSMPMDAPRVWQGSLPTLVFLSPPPALSSPVRPSPIAPLSTAWPRWCPPPPRTPRTRRAYVATFVAFTLAYPSRCVPEATLPLAPRKGEPPSMRVLNQRHKSPALVLLLWA